MSCVLTGCYEMEWISAVGFLSYGGVSAGGDDLLLFPSWCSYLFWCYCLYFSCHYSVVWYAHMFSLLSCPLLQKDVARCSVLHFSWFLVVSRLVQNECKVSTEGTLLFSSVDPNIKVTFPPGVTEETRSVKLQVCMPKKRSPGQPLVQLLTYVKQQNTG